ncbi:WD40-repeat-containing domain protein [Mycena capillaripes]|nr:WD40-repeat-containing domain protein [Mycena capillaripes]
MASQAIDVDDFPGTNLKIHPKDKRSSTSTPIVISDDEAETVAKPLASRNTETRSRSKDLDIEILAHKPAVPNVVDLVSDDEQVDSKHIRSSSAKGKIMSTRDVSSNMKRQISVAPTSFLKRSSSSTAIDIKPLVNASGSCHRRKTIYKGPELTIKQEPRVIKPKTEGPQIDTEDSEDEYEHTTMLRPYEWPSSLPRERLEPPAEPAQESTEPWPSKKRRYVNISSGLLPPMSTASSSSTDLWDVLRDLRVLPYFRPRPRFLSRKRPQLGEALDMDHYVKAHHFRRAGGSINGILQHDGRVVVCSNTAGGNATGETDPYNKPGTLISWCKRDPSKILDLEQGEEANLFRKHYSVHSIAFDPVSNILASSGADKHVRTWDFDAVDVDEPYSGSLSYQYKVRSRTASPHDLAFKPGASILAVGEQRLTIEDLSVANGKSHTFDLVHKRDQDAHITGALAWGSGLSSSLIFVLSEPVDNDNPDGHHHAFDVQALTPLFKFDAPEAGDALCVDSTGDTAALVTNDGVKSLLRIYDIRRKNSVANQTQQLERFTSREHEVNCMAFSSDSIYLALGRDDNRTHVYDSRMLERGVLYNFQHSEMRFSSRDQKFFGVVGVKWAESRFGRLGLVTGGNDGCIRLWDPLRANDGGTVLAQADSDIAYFTLGDRFKGEHELVMGDSDGAVYIMDGHASM